MGNRNSSRKLWLFGFIIGLAHPCDREELRAATAPKAAPAGTQECDDGNGNIRLMEACAEKDRVEADRRLNQVYQQAMKRLPQSKRVALCNSQRQWLAQLERRADQCARHDRSPGSREYPFVATICLTSLTDSRRAWIERRYGLQ